MRDKSGTADRALELRKVRALESIAESLAIMVKPVTFTVATDAERAPESVGTWPPPPNFDPDYVEPMNSHDT